MEAFHQNKHFKGEKNMKFPNAFAGVKKIFSAEILSLICSVCTTVMLAMPVIGLIAVANKSSGGAAASQTERSAYP